MKNYILILFGLFLVSCESDHTQFTLDSELEETPFRRDLEARLQSRGGDDPAVNLIIQAGQEAGQSSGKRCSKCMDKVDMHFYIGFNSFSKPSFVHALFGGFTECLNKFARYTYREGFLSHLKSLDWQFSHSMFSSGKNQPGYLEYDGYHVSEIHRSHARKSTSQYALTKRFVNYEDIFTYTLTRFDYPGPSFYTPPSHCEGADCELWYDAPKYNSEINDGGLENPLAGLSDILTNKYGVIRPGSRVEIFIITDYFPSYTDKVIGNFAKKYRGVRIHLLSSHSQSKYLGSLRDIARKTGGTVHQLCGDSGIGPKLAKIVRRK